MLTVDPSRRMTLAEVVQEPWMKTYVCPLLALRFSAHHCLAVPQAQPDRGQGPGRGRESAHAVPEAERRLADRHAGPHEVSRRPRCLSLSLASVLTAPDRNVDADGDQIMGTAAGNSQFTQTLMLFVRPLPPPLCTLTQPPHPHQSQTQGGRRYQPHLTRFYAGLMPPLLLPLIQEALTSFGVKWKPAQEVLVDAPDGSGESTPVLRMRVGGHDARRLMYKGWIRLERFKIGRYEGTYCVFARDQVSGARWL